MVVEVTVDGFEVILGVAEKLRVRLDVVICVNFGDKVEDFMVDV